MKTPIIIIAIIILTIAALVLIVTKVLKDMDTPNHPTSDGSGQVRRDETDIIDETPKPGTDYR